MPAPTIRSLLSERTVTSICSSQRGLYSKGSQVGPSASPNLTGSSVKGSAVSLVGVRTQRIPSKPSSVSAFQ